eukprot:g1479.t1
MAKEAQEVDDELAVRKVNPLIDHGLGAALLLLVVRLLAFLRHDMSLLAQFIASVFLAVYGIHAVRRGAETVGTRLSRWRTYEGIPEECRDPLQSKLAMKKWKDQAWQLAVHASMALYEWWLLSRNPGWWEDPGSCFSPCPEGDVEHAPELRTFYVIQLAIWIWTGASCKLLEERRKDYVEMMAHHVITVGLITSSLINDQLPIGLVVLTCHDASDVVLDLMKMANYLKVEDTHGLFVVEVLFVTNTYISWPYFRLYMFPVYVVSGAFFGYHARCATNGHAGDPWNNWSPLSADGRPLGNWLSSTIGLTALFCLHVYWFLLLHRIGMRILRGEDPNKAGNAEYEYTMKDREDKKGQ